MLETVVSSVILLCILGAIKMSRATGAAQERGASQTDQGFCTPRAHRLCLQAHELHRMPNNFDKIIADEAFKQGIAGYVAELACEADADKRASQDKGKLVQLHRWPNESANKRA
jgi:hypothetical protein